GGVALQALALYWPFLASILGTEPLPSATLARIGGISLLALALVETAKWVLLQGRGPRTMPADEEIRQPVRENRALHAVVLRRVARRRPPGRDSAAPPSLQLTRARTRLGFGRGNPSPGSRTPFASRIRRSTRPCRPMRARPEHIHAIAGSLGRFAIGDLHPPCRGRDDAELR